MTLESEGTGAIRLAGDIGLEDAENLLKALQASPGTPVDWTSVTSAHTAVIQVLIALKPRIEGYPANAFLREWIHPLIRGRG
jgi:hypothetical protein